MLKEGTRLESGVTGIMWTQPVAQHFLIVDDDDKDSLELGKNVTLLADKIIQVQADWVAAEGNCSPTGWQFTVPDRRTGFGFITESIKRFK